MRSKIAIQTRRLRSGFCLASLIVFLILPAAAGAQTGHAFYSLRLEQVTEYYETFHTQAPFDTLPPVEFIRLGGLSWVPSFLPNDFDRVLVQDEYSPGGRYRVRFTYPRTRAFAFEPSRDGVFLTEKPRDLGSPDVRIAIQPIDHRVGELYRETLGDVWRESVVTSIQTQEQTVRTSSGLNITIPVPLPSFAEKLIGQGEKTHIDISGRESITFSGESRVVSPFIGSEGQQQQSLFPSLDMKQELDVRLQGTIGEKVNIQVDHSSEAISSNQNRIRLNYRGFEDDIIQLIELGNTSLSLPGSELVSFSTSSRGLFGIKTLAQLGPTEITVIASKEEGETSSATFSPQGGTIGQRETREIDDFQYVKNRYFFLDHPNPQLYLGRIPAGYVGPYRPKSDSLEVFVSVPNKPETEPSWTASAWVDSANDGSFIGVGEPQVKDLVFIRLELGQDYRFLFDVDEPTLVNGIELLSPVLSGQVLAVSYVNEAGDVIGDFFESTSDSLQLELIWPNGPLPTDYTWGYMMRHIYNLGLSNIDAQSFNLEIHDKGTRSDNSDTSRPDSSTIAWIRVFGLDRTDQTGSGPPDNLIDLDNAFIDLNRGILQFPILNPFNPPDDSVNTWTDGQFTFTGSSHQKNPEIYAKSRPEDFSRYAIIVDAASTSRTFTIDAFNISEGSEVVRLDGRQLTRNRDYSIDYDTGEVELTGSVLDELTPSSNITIDYEFKPFAGGASSTLAGFSSRTNFSERAKFGTTWLYESKGTATDRPRLGEEPTRAVVGDVSGSLRFEPGFMTDVANWLPLVNTEQKSQVSVTGEVAMSMPDPNTLGSVYIDDFEGVEDSNVIPLTRRLWRQASPPLDPGQPSVSLADSLHAKVYWYNIEPDPGVHRRDLNPELNDQENTLVPSLDIELESLSSDPTLWTGVMSGFAGGGLDISKGQFLEIWVNDFKPDSLQRGGKLHIDLGFIDEDFYEPDVGLFDTEDKNRDGFNASTEDTGLDGEFSPAGDPDDDYVSNRIDGRFSRINGTEGNFQLDTEDLDRNGQLDSRNTYFSYEIDLASEPVVDVRREFPTSDRFNQESHQFDSWRLYRLNLSDYTVISQPGEQPTFEQIRHVRVWFDSIPDVVSTNAGGRVQIVGLKVVGNRWERDGIRTVTDELEADTLLSTFALGVISTKTDPRYMTPFNLEVQNDVVDKEQSLLVTYENIDSQKSIRFRRRFAGRGLDLTSYRDVSFLVHADSLSNETHYYFQLAFDSLNYYEVQVPMTKAYFGYNRWAWVTLALSDLTNLKFAVPDSSGITTGSAIDLAAPVSYVIRMRGRPNLFQTRFLYGGMRNFKSEPVSGELWVNDIYLGNRRRDVDFAQRASASLSFANVLTLNGAWRRTGADFRGLRARRGSGSDATGVTFNAKTAVNHFIPLFGFSLPVSGNYGRNLNLPKFTPNSDTEITDAALRDSLRTESVSRGFSASLTRRNSRFPLFKYTFDNLNTSFSMSQTRSRAPASADTTTRMNGTATYSLNFGQWPTLPFFHNSRFRYFLNSLNLRVNASRSKGRRWSLVGGEFKNTQKNYSANIDAGGSVSYVPFSALTSSFRMAAQRDLRLSDKELWGIPIGEETGRNHSLQLNFRPPPVFLIGAFSPDLNVSTNYREDAGPNVPRPGDPEGVRNVNNNRTSSLKLRFDLGRYLGAVFSKMKLLDDDKKPPPRGAPAPADTAAADTTKSGADPLVAVRKFASILSSIRKIDASVQERFQSRYTRVPGRPGLDYQFGLSSKSGVLFRDSLYNDADLVNKGWGLTLDSGVQITRNIDLAARFNHSRSRNLLAKSENFNTNTVWPDLSVSWKGLETFGPLSRFFNATTANFTWRTTVTKSGRGDVVDQTNESRQISPSAAFSWKNGMSSALSMQLNRSVRESRGQTNQNNSLSINLDMKYTFKPGGKIRIPLPFIRNKTLTSRLDTNLNIGYSRTSGKRSTGSLDVFEPIPGSSTVRVSPRMTYNFSRNLNGSFFIEYARTFNEASNQTVTTVRVGINAVFTF